MSDISSAQFLKEAFRLQSEKHYKQAIEALYKALCIEPENIEILAQISHLYFLLDNFERSFEYCEKILERNPDHIESIQTVIKICKLNNDNKKALTLSERLFNLAPDEENFLLYLELLKKCDEYEKLLAVIEKSASKSTDEKILSLKAFAYLKLNQIVMATQILHEIIRIYPSNYDAKFYLGVVNYNQNNFSEAEKIFSKILDTVQCDKTYNYLGLIAIEKYQISRAIDYFNYAAKIAVHNSIYRFNLATAYSLNGWLTEAENVFKTAITLEPENIVYNYSLAYLYYQRHDFKKALEMLDDILRIDVTYADAIILKALISAKSGNAGAAKNSLTNLLESVKDNDFLFYALGIVNKIFEMNKDAIQYLQQALFIKPESLEYLSELADCYCETEEYATAQDILAKVLYLNNHFIYAHLLQAKIYLKQNKYAQALKIVENAIRLDNSSAESYKYLSMIYSKQGLKNKSIENAKIAVTLQPCNKEFYAYLAELYFDAQEYENAFLYYKEAAAIDETNVDYFYKAAISADKNRDFTGASAYYSYALRLDPYNNLMIYEYVDLLIRNKKIKQALRLLKTKIANVKSKNIAKLLKQKYDEIKADYRAGFWQKLFKVFKK